MGKQVTHFFTLNLAEDGVRTRCGETVPADKVSAGRVTNDEAQVTCATCAKRRPVTKADVERAADLVEGSRKESLDDKSVYVTYTQRRVGVRKRVDVKKLTQQQNGKVPANAETLKTAVEVAEEATEPEADTSMLHLGKDIIDTAELRRIRHAQNAVYLWLYYKGYRSKIRPGFHILPLRLVLPFVEFAEAQEKTIEQEVEALIGRYPEIRARAKERLEPLGMYDPDDYPSPDELRGAFRIEYAFPIGLDKLETLSADLYKRERVKAARRAEEELESVVAALRGQVGETVDHMIAIFEPASDGRAKGFRGDSLDKAREFFELVKARNIGGDEKLEALADRAKALLAGVDPATLKGDADHRKRLKEAFEGVKAQLTSMVDFKATRKVKVVD